MLRLLLTFLIAPGAVASNGVFTFADYGVYREIEETERRQLDSSEQSVLSESITIKAIHVGPSHSIHNVADVLWGYRYTIDKSLGNTPITVKHVIKHPALDSHNGNSINEDVLFHKRMPGGTYNHLWYFEDYNENQSGAWSLDLYYNEQLVLTKQFQVIGHANKSPK